MFEMDNTDMEYLVTQTLKTSGFLMVNKKMIREVGLSKASFLCNLMDKFDYFRSRNMLQKDRSFFVTHAQQVVQTGLSERKLVSCKKFFKEQGVLETYMSKTIPPKEFYKLDHNMVYKLYLKPKEQEEDRGEYPPPNRGEYTPPNRGGIRRTNERRTNEKKFLPSEDCGPQDGPLVSLSKEFLPLVHLWNKLPKGTKHKIDNPPSKLLQRADKYITNLLNGHPLLTRKDGAPYKALKDFFQKHSINPTLMDKLWDTKALRSLLWTVHEQLPEDTKITLDQIFWNEHTKQGGFSLLLHTADRKETDPAALELARRVYTQDGMGKTPRTKLLNEAKNIAPLIEEHGKGLVKEVLWWHTTRPDTDKYKHTVRCVDDLIQKFASIRDAMKRSNQAKADIKEKDPNLVIQQEIPAKQQEKFTQRCFLPAKSLLPISSNGLKISLVENMVQLYNWIADTQTRHKSELRDRHMPWEILESYVGHITDQGWLRDKGPHLYRNDSDIFQKFLVRYGEYEFSGRNPVTGKVL